MKIQLDFDKKEVVIDSKVNIKDFYDNITTILTDYSGWTMDIKQTSEFYPLGVIDLKIVELE